MRGADLAGLAVVLALGAGCGKPQQERGPRPASEDPGRSPAAELAFSEATAEAGIRFLHANGARGGRLLPETMGSGVAVLDVDGDGWPDLFFVNGATRGEDGEARAALYRNLGSGRFVEVAEGGGAADGLVGMGAAVGDVDGDGRADLFVSGVGRDVLLRNRGDGRFEDWSSRLAGLPPGFGSSAAFLDADGDGWLDLYVGRYVTWSEAADVACRPDGEHRSYCTPEVYDGESSRLLRNRGDGSFVDVTREAGLWQPEGKTLGVVPLDVEGDGDADLAVANDTTRNFLFVNRGDGVFEERGVEAGMAFSESGAPRGGMGIDAGDLTGGERLDLVIGNFAQEMSALFRARPGGIFSDQAAQEGIGLPSLLTLAFGTLTFDADLDGWRDVALANGHIEPEIRRFQPHLAYAQPVQLFRQVPAERRFELSADPALEVPRVGRGLVTVDHDLDGDLDLVLTQNAGHAVLLRNEAAGAHWLSLRLTLGPGGRDALGARVTLEAGGRRRLDQLVSGRSYLSAPEARISFGLGAATRADRVDVRWPDGRRQRFHGLAADRHYVLALSRAEGLAPGGGEEAVPGLRAAAGSTSGPA